MNDFTNEPEATGRELAVIDRPRATTLAQRSMVGGMLRPIAAPAEVIEVQNETRALIQEALQEGRDYGKIPGTDKPSLYKAGAERVCAAFAVQPSYSVLEQEIDHNREVPWTKEKWVTAGKKPDNWEQLKAAGVGRNRKFDEKWVWQEKTTEEGRSLGLYRYVVECALVHRESGVVIGQGIGSCSTMESKYIDRPRDCENTVLKMAQKRALIAATLNAFGLSDQFTQDVEDDPRRQHGDGSDSDAGASGRSGGAQRTSSAPKTDPATDNQVRFIWNLMKSHKVVEAKRRDVLVKVFKLTEKTTATALELLDAKADMPAEHPEVIASKRDAGDIIEELQLLVTGEKGGQPQQEREPGADDDRDDHEGVVWNTGGTSELPLGDAQPKRGRAKSAQDAGH